MADFDDFFRAALIDAVRTRGTQARLSRDSGVGTSYINNIVKGRDSGSEATRRALASSLGFPGRRYEDFLEIGRAILDGRELPPPEPLSALDESLADFFRVPYSETIRLNRETGSLAPADLEMEQSPVMVHGPTIGRANPWGLRAFGVEDEVMEPLIAKGGRILVDLRKNDHREIKRGRIYVVCDGSVDGRGLIREIEWAGRDQDRLALKAAKGDCPVLYLPPREIVIVGQVIRAWRGFE